MKSNVLKDKSYLFAIRIVKFYQYMKEEKKEFIISKQVVRSGTAIGALIEEAVQGESKPDFIHKLSIVNIKKQMKHAIGSNYQEIQVSSQRMKPNP